MVAYVRYGACPQWQGRFDARRYFVGRAAAATYPAFWLGFGALFLYGEVLYGNNADIPRWRVGFFSAGIPGWVFSARDGHFLQNR